MNRANQLDDGTFVISDEGGWLPGVYESIEAVQIAHQIKHREDWHILQRLQDEANSRCPGGIGGTITEMDLIQAEAKHNG